MTREEAIRQAAEDADEHRRVLILLTNEKMPKDRTPKEMDFLEGMRKAAQLFHEAMSACNALLYGSRWQRVDIPLSGPGSPYYREGVSAVTGSSKAARRAARRKARRERLAAEK